MKVKSVCLSTVFIILLIFIAGCTSGSSIRSSPSASSIGSGQITNLNNGDSAVLSSNGYQETIMVYYNRTSRVIESTVTNTGNIAITSSNPSNLYAVDWGGVKYGGVPIDFTGNGGPYVSNAPPIYPGESYSCGLSGHCWIINLDDWIGYGNAEAKKGNMTLYVDFGNAEGSWIITP